MFPYANHDFTADTRRIMRRAEECITFDTLDVLHALALKRFYSYAVFDASVQILLAVTRHDMTEGAAQFVTL